MQYQGFLKKMVTQLSDRVIYDLPIGDELIRLNDVLGKKIVLEFIDIITCLHCGRKTNKSFSQGYCFPCFKKLPQCDICIMSPEKCHYHLGTCRDKSWGDSFCMKDHIVYLALSSNIKVGITRANQIPTRWVDQGATQAIALMKVNTRYQSGLIEALFKSSISDRTSWQKMLKGDHEPVDLKESAKTLLHQYHSDIIDLQNRFGIQAINHIKEIENTFIHYPVLHYPNKVKSLSFDKQSRIEGILQGIKGQYLILDTGVLNIRKHTAYHISITI